MALFLRRESLNKGRWELTHHSIIPHLQLPLLIHCHITRVDVPMEELMLLPLCKQTSQCTQNVPQLLLFKPVVILSPSLYLRIKSQLIIVNYQGNRHVRSTHSLLGNRVEGPYARLKSILTHLVPHGQLPNVFLLLPLILECLLNGEHQIILVALCPVYGNLTKSLIMALSHLLE